MSEEFHRLEESLKSFLISEQSDSYNSRGINVHKYNNLKIYMDHSQNNQPHFIVRIGISEAMYNMKNGERLAGGLGSDERLVRRWFDRGLGRADLDVAWKNAQKVKPVSMQEDEE